VSDFVFAPPAPVSLPIAGSAQRFPVARVFCIGRNYRWQAGEPAPTAMPAWFMKPASALAPADRTLPYPPGTTDFCHEIELVVALGQGGRDLDPARVLAHHVWGYAAGLDLTRRDLQQAAKRAGGPWEPAKAFDHSAPCSAVVPAAASGHARTGAIWLTVNGVERQRADIGDLLWSVPELVAMLSRSVRLAAGDLIFTGTPAGVAPLVPEDVVRAGIAGVGELSLVVGAAPVGAAPVGAAPAGTA